jgi:hypothetical protein
VSLVQPCPPRRDAATVVISLRTGGHRTAVLPGIHESDLHERNQLSTGWGLMCTWSGKRGGRNAWRLRPSTLPIVEPTGQCTAVSTRPLREMMSMVRTPGMPTMGAERLNKLRCPLLYFVALVRDTDCTSPSVRWSVAWVLPHQDEQIPKWLGSLAIGLGLSDRFNFSSFLQCAPLPTSSVSPGSAFPAAAPHDGSGS